MDIVRTENQGYARYEELLLERDRLRKEAHILHGEYMKEFGELIVAVFEKRIACIQKKKTIAFCQAAINRGDSVDEAALDDYIQAEMEAYRWQLEEMIADNDAARNSIQIPIAEVAKIKKIYHRIAKRLHPDMNPKTGEIPELIDLWNMVSAAYIANDLESIEELEVLVNRALKAHNISEIVIEISNLDERISKLEEEIFQIKENEPYQYKYLLSSERLVRERKASLQKELEEYASYEEELNQVVEMLMGGGNQTWQMS